MIACQPTNRIPDGAIATIGGQTFLARSLRSNVIAVTPQDREFAIVLWLHQPFNHQNESPGSTRWPPQQLIQQIL